MCLKVDCRAVATNELTLLNRFPPGVGMMVAGKLEARGRKVNDILLTLREEIVVEPPATEMETEAPLPGPDPTPVRLLGGRTEREGRLQVHTSLPLDLYI